MLGLHGIFRVDQCEDVNYNLWDIELTCPKITDMGWVLFKNHPVDQ